MNLAVAVLTYLFVNFAYSQQLTEEYENRSNESLFPEFGPPNSIDISNITETSAHVSWTPPVSRSMQANILQYDLVANVIFSYSNKTFYPRKFSYSSNTLRSEIASLQPGSKYNITIRAVYPDGISSEMFKVINTPISEPDRVPQIEIVKHEGTTMTIRLFPIESSNGPVSFYRIIVANMDNFFLFQPDLLQPYDLALKSELSYYITADINPPVEPIEFVIGDGKYYNGFYNGPLTAGAEYNVLMGVVSTLDNVTKIRYSIDRDSVTWNLYNPPEDSSTLVITLAIAVGVASILLLIGLIVLLIVRRRFHQNRRQRLSDNQEFSMSGPMIQVANHGYLLDEESGRVNHYNVLKQKVWNIPRDNLVVNAGATGDSFLGFGKFGHVVKGTVQKTKDEKPMTISCYIITDGDLTNDSKRLMLRQLDTLIKGEQHENVASLIGTCETPETVYVVLEHSTVLFKDTLLNNRFANQTSNKFTTLNESKIFDILTGIANGMDYLAKNNIIHERLCCRNVFIYDGHLPKITGHGLSNYNRNNITSDYSRWTAVEVLQKKPFNFKSDVWSYGCLIWEACCLGGTPYNNLEQKVVEREVCRGARLPKLPYIGSEFYQFMLICWQSDPDERSTFHEIIEQMHYFKETLEDCAHLDFSMCSDFSFEPYEPIMETQQEYIS